MDRLYSWLNIRAVDEEKRIIEGIATTPEIARDGDILETKGIQFKLPLPFLWRHYEPFGNVVAAKVGDDGITVRIQIADAGVSDSINEYWRLVKSGTVRGLSIGWRTLQELYDKEIAGYRILKSEWLELSAVPVPADANALITSVRSADEAILAALGRGNGSTARRIQPQPTGVPASAKHGGIMIGIQEKITKLEGEREPLATRITGLMETADTESREMTDVESREYDGLTEKVEKIDKDLRRARAYLAAAGTSVAVPREAQTDPAVADRARGPRVEVNRVELPKGTGMARAVIALVNAGGNHFLASQLAKDNYRDTPEVSQFLKSRAYVASGDTTTPGWASELVPAAQQLASEFLDLLRPATILGRMTGLRRVPFNVAVPLQSGGGTYGWVGEAKRKPVTSLIFGKATLRWAKVSGIIVITTELARFSSPLAEESIRNDMVKGCARFLDGQLLDSTLVESNTNPGGITQGIGAETPSGTTADAFRFDLSVLMASFIANNQDPSTAILLMSATTAMGLSLMVNAFGQQEFPGITITGGNIQGLPVLVSETVSDRLILVNQSDILLADDGGVTIDVSREATIEMSSTPTTGEESPVEGTVQHNMFQNNEIALRVERFITWKRARTSAVEWQDNVAYAPANPGA